MDSSNCIEMRGLSTIWEHFVTLQVDLRNRLHNVKCLQNVQMSVTFAATCWGSTALVQRPTSFRGGERVLIRGHSAGMPFELHKGIDLGMRLLLQQFTYCNCNTDCEVAILPFGVNNINCVLKGQSINFSARNFHYIIRQHSYM